MQYNNKKMNNTNKNNDTLSFRDIDVSQITVENEVFGKDKRNHSMIRYGPYKKQLLIQCPWVKMNQYGLLPGQYLKDGKKNEYYVSEESRCFVRFPVDAENSYIIKPDGSNNSSEIAAFITKMKEIDEHIKKSDEIRKAAEINEDDIEKYNCLFRKAKSGKKIAGKEQKTKYNYMKPKIDMNYPNKDEVKTKFYEMKEDKTMTLLTAKEDFVKLSDIESLLVYNCEQQCVIRLVEVWTQSLGTWGITTKIQMMRVKKPSRSVKESDAEFVDEDDFTEVTNVKKPIVESDGSDDEKKVEHVEVKSSKPVPVKKQIAQVDSDDSDDEPPAKGLAKKIMVSDNSDDEIVPVSVKKVVKKDVESDDDAVPVKKPNRKVKK